MNKILEVLHQHGDKYILNHPQGEFIRFGKLESDLNKIKELESKLAEANETISNHKAAVSHLTDMCEERDSQLSEALEVVKLVAPKREDPESEGWFDHYCSCIEAAREFLGKYDEVKV